MTGLLVSVRDSAETAEAMAGGADVIDVKEPRRGALGAADPDTWQAVRQILPHKVPMSVALGELVDPETANRAAQVPSIQYAKVGLAGCLDHPDWRSRWADVLGRLPEDVERVAVGYADHTAAHAPDPQEVLRVAPTVRCRTLLLDTLTKHQGNLFDYMADDQLARLADACREAGIALVLAGSLQLTSIDRALRLAPKLVAVRGAACLGDRNGTVCGALVKQLKARITVNFQSDLIST